MKSYISMFAKHPSATIPTLSFGQRQSHPLPCFFSATASGKFSASRVETSMLKVIVKASAIYAMFNGIALLSVT